MIFFRKHIYFVKKHHNQYEVFIENIYVFFQLKSLTMLKLYIENYQNVLRTRLPYANGSPL